MEPGGTNPSARCRSKQLVSSIGRIGQHSLTPTRRAETRFQAVKMAGFRLRENAERIYTNHRRPISAETGICSFSSFKIWSLIPVLRIVPALEVRFSLLDECLARFHQVALRAVILKARSQPLKIVRHLGAHGPHHD